MMLHEPKIQGPSWSDLKAHTQKLKEDFDGLREENQRLRAELSAEINAHKQAIDAAVKLAEEVERLKPLAELGKRVEAMPENTMLYRRYSEWRFVWSKTGWSALWVKTALEALRAAGIGGEA